jgi:hypothetical protein
MNLQPTVHALSSAHLKSADGQQRRIGKAANFNMLGEDGERLTESWNGLSGAPTFRQPCQNGTIDYAPLWNGPALRPAFAAQVLGQVAMGRKTLRKVPPAQSYWRGQAHVPAALLLDVSI